MNVNALTSDISANDAKRYTTASVSPGANRLVLVYITSATPTLGGAPDVPTITGSGLTWDKVADRPFGNDGRRLSCFRALGPAPAAGPLTIDFGNQNQDLCAWSVIEIDGVNQSGTSGSGAIAQSVSDAVNASSLSIPLPLPPGPNAIRVGGIALAEKHAITAGAGTTEIHQKSVDQGLAKDATLQTERATAAATTLAWSWTGSSVAAAIVVEVKAAPTTGPPPPDTSDEGLARRFEPVLLLHPAETFFPSDAKRFVERAALWSATSPADDKNNWTSVVPAQGLAAAESEPGDFLGDHLSGGGELFLEIGGWTDTDGVAEPDVSAATSNKYANHAEIESIYGSELQSGRFWYHAEVIRGERLQSLAGGPPDFRKTLTSLRLTDPTLLCYYFLFPDHEQPVTGAGCSSVTSAAELAGHAGDWQCLTILLDGDGSNEVDKYVPKFFGVTGLRPAPVEVDGELKYRPHQFDDEFRAVMKVERWKPDSRLPELASDHPQLYVARGSHSFYVTAGDATVDPYPDDKVSHGCGSYPTPGLTPPEIPGEDSLSTPEWIAVIAKMVTFGWPLNVVVGWAAAIIEMVEGMGSFGAASPDADRPIPDRLPASVAQSIVVRPSSVTVPAATGRVETWRNQQNLEINGRRYDFLVDRENQVWWPHDDNERGFRGRWGQRVSSDPISRQCGPPFPNYVGMFLGALEDGVTRKFFAVDG
ncbi:hypothetical protein [Mycolicibacterium frederiksbergense]|uniref:hypothetical protein n=1 Tax=Mycolicibacterium frederiksbergense TaxID=117567 RepID=UPI00265C4483|nr:hypothetical protein [Mycolicibacterium frederiksbergense]MDO0973860.1 hypothetical protein [Mycolicibacterium frederiksbergense]